MATAVDGRAEVLVTGDRDLLEAADAAPLAILSPRAFWERLRLGLGQGDQVEFTLEDGAAVLRPVPPDDDPFGAYAGALGTLADEAAVVAWLRDLRDARDDDV